MGRLRTVLSDVIHNGVDIPARFRRETVAIHAASGTRLPSYDPSYRASSSRMNVSPSTLSPRAEESRPSCKRPRTRPISASRYSSRAFKSLRPTATASELEPTSPLSTRSFTKTSRSYGNATFIDPILRQASRTHARNLVHFSLAVPERPRLFAPPIRPEQKGIRASARFPIPRVAPVDNLGTPVDGLRAVDKPPRRKNNPRGFPPRCPPARAGRFVPAWPIP